MQQRWFLAASLFFCSTALSIGCGSVKTGSAATTTTSPPTSSSLTIVTVNMPSGVLDSSYSVALTAKGGTAPYVWSVLSGTLPSGLQLNSSTGVISGSPSTAGEQTVQVGVEDSEQSSARATLTISIASKTSSSAPTQQLSIKSASPPDATVGQSYSFTLAAQGGTAPYSWSTASGVLPQGLQLNASQGLIKGTPTQAGNTSATIEVRDSDGATSSHSFSFSVVAQTVSSNNFRSFYVDSAGGNDDNAGNSESAPWKTIAKVNSSNFLPGDHTL